MATIKQRKAVKKFVENLGESSPKSAGKILKEAGYSEVQAKNPAQVLDSKGFQAVLNTYIKEDDVIEKFKDHINCNDRRVSLQAIVEYFKLANKYPAKKVKVEEFKREVKQVYLPEEIKKEKTATAYEKTYGID
jgi:hypothetical protein